MKVMFREPSGEEVNEAAFASVLVFGAVWALVGVLVGGVVFLGFHAPVLTAVVLACVPPVSYVCFYWHEIRRWR